MNTAQPPAPLSPFEGIRHQDADSEYWSARDLMTVLDYALWQNFRTVIKKAIIACQGSGQQVSDHFIDINKMVTLGSGAQRSLKDYRLSRYACYLIAQNADPAKEIVALAQTYFAVKTRAQEILEMELTTLVQQLQGDPLAEVVNRIILRQELTETHKALLDQAHTAGIITTRQYALFMNQGYRGLYGGETEDDIHRRKGLKPSQHIGDYMGAIETFANLLRAQITTRQMRAQQVTTPHTAGALHFDAGQDVRDLMVRAGLPPEHLPTPTKSYRQIVKEEAERLTREEEDTQGLWGPRAADDGKAVRALRTI